MAGPRLTQIWADTIRQQPCKAPSCGKTLWFAQNVRTGNYMPFVQKPVPVIEQPELETGRLKWTVDCGLSHFVDCPGASGFRRRR